MLGPLRRDHDLILMDNRGVGRSGAIDCKRLQADKGSYTRNVAACARQLGAAADAYGTGAAADDLAAVLDRLDVPVVSLYGDSYGTYFAQAFAVRHPERVRAVVLDAAYAVDYFDPWARTATDALRYAWTVLCQRSPECAEDPLVTLRRLAQRLDAVPLTGRSRDADGTRRRVRLDGAAFAQLTFDASYTYAIFRDLLAAGRAYEAGDPEPLLRLAAEDLSSTAPGPATGFSVGAYAAVACHDYPTIWRVSSSFAQRRAELAAARRALPGDAFSPFPKRTFLESLYQDQLVSGCLAWPAPARPDPPVAPGATYPDVPVLVLDGDLDVVTPLSDSARAAALFPNSTQVTVENAVHVTALADFDDCAAAIVRRFLRTQRAGDTSCASRLAELRVVPRFPRHLASAPAASPRAGDRSRRLDRRAAWVAARAVADAFSRWWLMSGARGHGLRGGSFVAEGAYLAREPLRLRLDGIRFVRDLAVSGSAAWDRRALGIHARLRLTGARRGTLRMSWSTSQRQAVATVTGRIGGRAIRLHTPAP